MRLLQWVILQRGEQIVKIASNHQEVPQTFRSDKDEIMIDNIIMSLSPWLHDIRKYEIFFVKPNKTNSVLSCLGWVAL